MRFLCCNLRRGRVTSYLELLLNKFLLNGQLLCCDRGFLRDNIGLESLIEELFVHIRLQLGLLVETLDICGCTLLRHQIVGELNFQVGEVRLRCLIGVLGIEGIAPKLDIAQF